MFRWDIATWNVFCFIHFSTFYLTTGTKVAGYIVHNVKMTCRYCEIEPTNRFLLPGIKQRFKKLEINADSLNFSSFYYLVGLVWASNQFKKHG